jgi:hypothetical protein
MSMHSKSAVRIAAASRRPLVAFTSSARAARCTPLSDEVSIAAISVDAVSTRFTSENEGTQKVYGSDFERGRARSNRRWCSSEEPFFQVIGLFGSIISSNFFRFMFAQTDGLPKEQSYTSDYGLKCFCM